MPDCIFCRIVRGEIPADIVYRDEDVVAFRDINPQAPVHILVVPVRHIPELNETSDDDAVLLGKLLLTAVKIAGQEGIGGSGYRLVVNQGRDAGQSVDHLHVHLLGGRAMAWPPG
ncbi:MAG: histidine triad nucleotide-binding protein [Armatimonadetes bacterium]|nr:histidine triad nucleotide-binding protein [Armatimonadota bacterium]